MGVLKTIKDAWRKNVPELTALWNGALPEFVISRRPRELREGVPVFSYHLVEPESFEADLDFLNTNGYTTLSSRVFLEYLAGQQTIPERSVLLTFDDGPKNFYDVTFPLLQRFGAKAIAFIAPGLHSDEEAERPEARPMSWREIQTIHASGCVEFQSHTLESRFAPQWPQLVPLVGCDPALENSRRRVSALPFVEDLAASKAALEAHLPQAQIDQLAFPRYLGTDAAVEAARSLGFRACYWGLTPGRAVNRRGDSPFFVSRINDEFLRRLPGTGRISWRQMLDERLRRVRAAREWRRRYSSQLALNT